MNFFFLYTNTHTHIHAHIQTKHTHTHTHTHTHKHTQTHTKFFVQKVLFLQYFGSCQICMSSANLVAEIHQKLCNKRSLSTGEPCTCEYVTLLQPLHKGTLSIHWYNHSIEDFKVNRGVVENVKLQKIAVFMDVLYMGTATQK